MKAETGGAILPHTAPLRSHRAPTPQAKSAGPRSTAIHPHMAPRADGPRLAVAERELQRLEAQEPTNFLALFDMMREERRWNERTLDTARGESHAYILARMGILERMLRRFIDDPESDASVETEALARIDADFHDKMESLSRDVPELENVQAMLTTTILKAPAFTDRDPEAE